MKFELLNGIYGARLEIKPERVISAEIAVFVPNCVSWSECWDGEERQKQSLGKTTGLGLVPRGTL
jgi:hypothetical protein